MNSRDARKYLGEEYAGLSIDVSSLVVAVALLVYRATANRPGLAMVRAPALYAIGAVAAYWSIGRIVTIVT